MLSIGILSLWATVFATADRQFCMPEMKYMIAPAMLPPSLLKVLNSPAI